MTSSTPPYVIHDVMSEDCHDEKTMLEKIMSVSYGLCLTSFQLLGGYDDVNYQVTAVEEVKSHEPCTKPVLEKSYVVRIINANDSKDPTRIEATNAILDHAIRKGVKAHSNVLNRENQTVSLWRFNKQDKEEVRVVCLRTFLPGESLSNVTSPGVLCYKLGAFVAHVTRALEDFHHPFFDTFNFGWSIDNIESLSANLHFVKDNKRRQVLKHILDHLPIEMFRDTSSLKTGQIHGDISFNNIIFQNPGDFLSDFSQWGLIDFHDTHKTFCLYELAVSACSLRRFIDKETLSTSDAMRHLLAGYRSIIPLSRRDLEFLVFAIKARLCSIIIYGHRQCHMDPNNERYINSSLNPAWEFVLDIYGKSTQTVIASF